VFPPCRTCQVPERTGARDHSPLKTALGSSHNPAIKATSKGRRQLQSSLLRRANSRPGRLSVGTLVCESPNAPLVSMMDRRYGAMTSPVARGTLGEPSGVKTRSARSPSAEKVNFSKRPILHLGPTARYLPTISTTLSANGSSFDGETG
jgi:hypothetical protein